jgi:hypothetical protein
MVEYATVAALDLIALDLPADLKKSQITVEEGEALALSLIDGQIRFITPSDPGFDERVVFHVALEDRDVKVPVRIVSARPSEVVAYVESDEAGEVDEAPALAVTGLSATNAFVGNALSFHVEGAPPLDPGASSATLFNPLTSAVVDLTKFWTFDADTNEFSISASDMAVLLAQLPAADVNVTVALASEDGEFAYAWNFLAHKPIATLHGSVVDLKGKSSSELDGRWIGVRGLDNLTRRIVKVEKGGTFTADELVEGTYEVTLLDPAAPGFWRSTVPVFTGATDVDLSFPYGSLDSTELSSALKSPDKVVAVRSFSTSKAAANVASRGLPRGVAAFATPAECEVDLGDGKFEYKATAAAKDSTITCLAQPTVPKGTKKLGLLLEVYSAEYPTYTTAKSQYNDTWAYAVSGLPGVGSDSGAVNDTHYTQGTISKEVCLDVSSLTAKGDFSFSASLAATNIGDSALATSVKLVVTPECEVGLSVTDAVFSSPNQAGHAVIRPLVGASNLTHHYISIPIGAKASAWGVPLMVHYQPAKAEITAVKVGVMVDGDAVMAEENVLPQATKKGDGQIWFKNLNIPQFKDLDPFTGRTNVIVQLFGKVDGEESESKPENGVVTFSGQRTFVPLFLAGEEFDDDRRYGVRDTGGDSWATYGTVQWLMGRAYRFDDITGLHAPQTANGRSVLGHAGHSDGTQMDLRYSDGSGGYTDQLGGAGEGAAIKKLLSDAAKEVASGAAEHPKLDLLLDWIAANRAMAELEAPHARNIYMGNSWMKLALYDGKFENGTAIPGVDKWTSKPAVVSFIGGHLHHWHVSRNDL